MELREWATLLLSADTLEGKLFKPDHFTDHQPGSPLFWKEPVRPKGMEFKPHSRKDRLPSLKDLSSKDNRAICLHRFGGHELLAVEIMAYALLAFPNAPKHFRRGIANTLVEEQEHVRLYQSLLHKFGVNFGDLPLYKHFWAYTPHLRTPAEYVSVMSLTFEMANLDYAPAYGAAFSEHGDEASASLMQRIFLDEISHVSFGWNWLKKLKDKKTPMWNAWINALPRKDFVKKAQGNIFNQENRIKAGVTLDWLKRFKESILSAETCNGIDP